MDIKKSKLNVSVSILFRLFMLAGSILVRRFLIRYIGNEVNGLDSLYASLIGFLSVAELGVGSAITFCMYKPIVDGDESKVAALYQLFTRTYRIIAAVMFGAGLLMIPFLPYLAKDYTKLDVNLGVTFLLMLVSVVTSYAFSAKTSLINAYKNNYVTTTISSVGMLIQYGLQLIAILATKSFSAYLICRTAAMLLQWAATEWYARRHHRDILHHGRETVDAGTRKEILDKVKALFMHRVGGILVNSADSMIISAFIGVVVLGKYSNYSTIAVSMSSVIALAFTPLTSVVGHAYVTEREKTEQHFRRFYFLNYALGVVFFFGYYAIIDDLVLILFGDNLELSKSVSFIITVNYFIQFMRQATLLFRDATGTFYHDRWKPLFEGGLNVVLSILFLKWFTAIGGEEFGVVGVIAATIITNLTICHVIEPLVLYRHAFEAPVRKHMARNYLYMAVFVAALLLLSRCMKTNANAWLELLINGSISVGFSAGTVALVALTDPGVRRTLLARLRQKRSRV